METTLRAPEDEKINVHTKILNYSQTEKLSILHANRIEYELKAATWETGSGRIFYVISCVTMFLTSRGSEHADWSSRSRSLRHFVSHSKFMSEKIIYLAGCSEVVSMCWPNVVTFEPVASYQFASSKNFQTQCKRCSFISMFTNLLKPRALNSHFWTRSLTFFRVCHKNT